MKVFVTYGKSGKITSIGVPNPKFNLLPIPRKGLKTAEVDAPGLDIEGEDKHAQFSKIVTNFRVRIKGSNAVLVRLKPA